MSPAAVRLAGLRLPLAELPSRAAEEQALARLVCRKVGADPRDLLGLERVKQSLDARDKDRLRFVYTVDARFRRSVAGEAPPKEEFSAPVLPQAGNGLRPVVVGGGPAGLLAALTLAEAGLRPILLEQGKPVEARGRDVARFWSRGELDPGSNIQFGEGGAGAFSDGKLTSRSKDRRGLRVLRVLVECGAQPEILYWHKPHIGSDRLPIVIANLRQRIRSAGGEFFYQRRLTDLVVSQGRLTGLVVENDRGEPETLAAEAVILATGNSGRALYRSLAARGLAMEAKPLAVGLRVQHPQGLIDRDQYGPFAGHPLLGAADYQLTYRDETQDRGCYTFCNCPGGHIVNASSEETGLVVNGMSYAARNSGWSNSAVVAQVFPGRDFGREPLDGLVFQERLEQAAWSAAGGGHRVPVMSIRAFLGEEAGCGQIEDTAAAQIKTWAWTGADLRSILGEALTESLSRALRHWERQLPGFAGAGLLAAVESRTSAPLRLLRGTDGMSLNCRGLFPAGEGAGYAGGIVSSGIDGIRQAEALLEALASR